MKYFAPVATVAVFGIMQPAFGDLLLTFFTCVGVGGEGQDWALLDSSNGNTVCAAANGGHFELGDSGDLHDWCETDLFFQDGDATQLRNCQFGDAGGRDTITSADMWKGSFIGSCTTQVSVGDADCVDAGVTCHYQVLTQCFGGGPPFS